MHKETLPQKLAPPTILKFGGTSVGTADAISKSMHKVASTPGPKVVVTSACAGVTNMLHSLVGHLKQAEIEYQAYRTLLVNAARKKSLSQIRTNSNNYTSSTPPQMQTSDIKAANKHHRSASTHALVALSILREIKALHEGILSQLNLPINNRNLEDAFDSLRLKIFGAILLRHLSPANSNAICSMGEYLSSAILESHYKQNYAQIQLMDTAKLLKKSNSDIDGATVNQQYLSQMESLLETNFVVLLQGYLLTGESGLLDNFGRGGSDYTAALLGKILNAGKVVIYTDVDGVYSGDPRAIPEAKLLKSISPDVMAIMAKFGAKVMHPASLKPAIDSGIPLFIKNTFSDAKGTEIKANTNDKKQSTARSIPTITSSQHLFSISINALDVDKLNIDIIEKTIKSRFEVLLSQKTARNWQLICRQTAGESGSIIDEILQTAPFAELDAHLGTKPMILLTSVGKPKSFTDQSYQNVIISEQDNKHNHIRLLTNSIIENSYYIGYDSYLLVLYKSVDSTQLRQLHNDLQQTGLL